MGVHLDTVPPEAMLQATEDEGTRSVPDATMDDGDRSWHPSGRRATLIARVEALFAVEGRPSAVWIGVIVDYFSPSPET